MFLTPYLFIFIYLRGFIYLFIFVLGMPCDEEQRPILEQHNTHTAHLQFMHTNHSFHSDPENVTGAE